MWESYSISEVFEILDVLIHFQSCMKAAQFFFCLTQQLTAAKVFSYVWLLSRKQLYFFASVLLTQKKRREKRTNNEAKLDSLIDSTVCDIEAI